MLGVSKKKWGVLCPIRKKLIRVIMQNLDLEQFPKPDRDREGASFIFSSLRGRGASSRIIESGIDQT